MTWPPCPACSEAPERCECPAPGAFTADLDEFRARDVDGDILTLTWLPEPPVDDLYVDVNGRYAVQLSAEQAMALHAWLLSSRFR